MIEPVAGFDPFVVPLAGQQLIEASAGTGKTYSIAGLYLRLVLEQALPVERILVVTYTNAATAELRERIRRRLVELRAALDSGVAGDELTEGLLARVEDADVARRRVDAAVLGFDTAAVHTIHGFCQRALAEHAFASGVAFERELVPDPSERLRRAVEDCWRREVYAGDARFVAWLLENGQSPAAWMAFLRPYVAKPYLEVRTPPPPVGEDLERALDAAFASMARHYDRDAVVALLLDGSLNAASYKEHQVLALCDAVEGWVAVAGTPAALPREFDRFTPARIAKATKKAAVTPEHPFFDACATFAQRVADREVDYQRRLAHLRARLLAETRAALETSKRERRELSYDDLLLDLAAALAGRGGARLAAALRERYPAALVDEFQDTDPVQYQILRAVYGGSDAPVVLVGDPKQAIYRFRGADVFAYLAGGAEAAGHHTLTRNWRSSPALIDGVNTLFSRHRDAFVLPGIQFSPAVPADREHALLVVKGEPPLPPLRLWHAAAAKGHWTKTEAAPLAARATATEIARLLGAAAHATATLGGHVVAGGDIAVLVLTHHQGGLVREALRDLGVGSVQLSGESVFATHEADELLRLLAALAEPGREALLRGALLTDLLGGDGELLARLQEDEALLDDWLSRLAGLHRVWLDRGLLPALRALFEAERVPGRLLGLVNGERRLTNTQHLAEMLQQGPVAAGLGPAGTVKWLGARIAAAAGGGREEDEVQQLRLESDENLVNIVTVHRSKGLQYPLVFCPFLWDAKLPRGEPGWLDWHDPADHHQHVLDLGSEDFPRAREGAAREALAEAVRLAYVALTRAEQRCYVAVLPCKDFERSALGWLLREEGVPVEQTLATLAESRSSALAVSAPPEDGAPLPRTDRAGARLQAREPAGAVRSERVIGSFSSLLRGHAADRPDHDAGTAAPGTVDAAPAGIFAFPRGARAGTCLHAVFEGLDFVHAATDAGRAALEQRAETRLRAHGYAGDWKSVVADMVQAVLATPLDQDGDARLAQVSSDRCLHELEFCYPVTRLRAADLQSLLGRFGLPPLPGASGDGFAPLAGYLKGYVDLVFEAQGRWYVLDWKSNWLGADPSHYSAPLLAPVMAREGYHLQYLLYTLALHRWLRLRLPDYHYSRHFGGVRYLFLRGVSAAHGAGNGVYATLPPLELLDALDTLLGAPVTG